MSIIDDLKWRYAAKKFDKDKKVSAHDMQILLESLTLTASSFGLQPWKFVVVENQVLKDQLVPVSYNQEQVGQASHVIVLARPLEFGMEQVEAFLSDTAKKRGQELSELDGYKNVLSGFLANFDEASLTTWMDKQLYIALGNLLTTAAHLRIDSCPMEGFIKSEYDRILGLKDLGLTSVLVCPVGYRDGDDKYAGLKKIRYDVKELVVTL